MKKDRWNDRTLGALADAFGVYLLCGYLYALQCSLLSAPGSALPPKLALRPMSATGPILTLLEVALGRLLPKWIFSVSPLTIALLFLPCGPTLLFVLLRWLFSKRLIETGKTHRPLEWAMAAGISLLFLLFFGPPLPN